MPRLRLCPALEWGSAALTERCAYVLNQKPCNICYEEFQCRFYRGSPPVNLQPQNFLDADGEKYGFVKAVLRLKGRSDYLLDSRRE